ncbi:MAG: DUF4421 domain-containing protein [Muribaculaceae bacterium]|nr:DUF4421 domain-containing protein [Muribaculaceae bacterium]
MPKSAIILTTSILLATALSARAETRACALPEMKTEIAVTASPPPADSIRIDSRIKTDWKKLARDRRLDINDTTARYPAFIDWCVNVYRWAERVFNTYDPEYVTGTGKHGKVRLVSDNWTDSYMFRFEDGNPLFMISNLYANIGIQANYSILSASYSIDMNSALSDRVSKHKKLGFSFSCARLYGEGYYWKNNGGTTIRKFGHEKVDDIPFHGLEFRAFGALAFYIFNSRRFSYAAAYNLSNYQLRSAGSWLLGMNGTFYECDFDFSRLPEEIKTNSDIPFNTYSLDYNSVNVMGGYSYNWVANKHFLINVTLLPSAGISFSRSDSTEGHRNLLSMGCRQMASITYTSRQFFITGTSSLHVNYFLTRSVGFISGIENFQISTGVRF